jgi:hypothetical protein
MYEVVDYFNNEGENVIAIEITDGEFTGTIFSYGEVSFPDPDQPILSFYYTVHESNQDTESDRFKNTIGDMLTEMIEESLKDKETIFKGGI